MTIIPKIHKKHFKEFFELFSNKNSYLDCYKTQKLLFFYTNVELIIFH